MNLIDENNDIEVKKQIRTVPFYFVDKDPETGKRRSTPIIDQDISMVQCIELFENIEFVQLVNMYLI